MVKPLPAPCLHFQTPQNTDIVSKSTTASNIFFMTNTDTVDSAVPNAVVGAHKEVPHLQNSSTGQSSQK